MPATEPQQTVEQILKWETAAIPEEERQYYQPDSYYTAAAYPGSHMERAVVPFEHRKKTAVPSRNGLYPAEILLLSYCSKYPNPTKGYPGFWWFEYGVRDVGGALRSLESRGFLRWSTAAESLNELKIPELKAALSALGAPVTGKKAELIQRLQGATEEQLSPFIPQRRYALTPLGRQELDENEYVLYMHRLPGKTIEVSHGGPSFNLWTVNRQLAGQTKNWTQVVEAQQKLLDETLKAKNKEFLRRLEESDPQKAAVWAAQNQLLADIQAAERQYSSTGDIHRLIAFWEDVWAKGDPSFHSSHWAFRLPDLYLQLNRWDEAEAILHKIKDPVCQEKVGRYLQQIEKKRVKS